MAHAPDFPTRLTKWFSAHRRDLPWRRVSDPWAIWVSEVMLQQTRVEAVREPYARFLTQYPTPQDFAVATDDQLLAAWRGLGYYRRARLLREGARKVTEEHGGTVPQDPDLLRALPGIGHYTLGAIASIAFGLPEPAIDGNVERVLARHRGLRQDVKAATSQRKFRELLSSWLATTNPSQFNQALMELGALVCTPRQPTCDACPVAADCVARIEGLTGQLPIRKPPPTIVPVTARVAIVLERSKALGARIPAGEVNAGQVELPGAGMLCDVAAEDLPGAILQRFDARLETGPSLGNVRHAITCHRITVHAHPATVSRQGQLQWFAIDTHTPWTTPCRKLFQRLLGTDGQLHA